MAGTMSNSSRKMAAAFGKRLVTQISSSSTRSSSSSALVSRRAVHGSVYDKNVDDNINPVVVPDDIVQPQSEKYWSPNPQTGVFGPAADHNLGGERGFHTSAANGGTESVLEQQTFFRPQEDLDKPQPA